jgi:hypothetical protein
MQINNVGKHTHIYIWLTPAALACTQNQGIKGEKYSCLLCVSKKKLLVNPISNRVLFEKYLISIFGMNNMSFFFYPKSLFKNH